MNGGAVAGVTCFSVDHTDGLTLLGGLRTIALGQTTPPVGPAGTVSDLVFNPSETALIATVKGNGNDAGFIYAYPVLPSGSISTTPVVSRPSALALDFSINFLGDDFHAVITDPSFGAAFVDISPALEFAVQTKDVIPGEGAICWSVYSERFDTVFIIDAGTTSITLADPATGAVKGTYVLDAAGKGSLDSKMDRQFLYTLRVQPFITVSDVMGLTHGAMPTEVQSFSLASLGNRQGFNGMAIYPS